jgi:hypothetical protein
LCDRSCDLERDLEFEFEEDELELELLEELLCRLRGDSGTLRLFMGRGGD